MKQESRAYMHKDGFTFDSRGRGGGRVRIVNLRRDENKRFRNGNSRFIFPRRILPLSNRTSCSSKQTASKCFRNLANIFRPASRVYLRWPFSCVCVCVDIRVKNRRKKKETIIRERDRVSWREKFPRKLLLLLPRNDQLFPPSSRGVQLLGERRKGGRLSSFEKENRNYDSVVTSRLRHWEESVTLDSKKEENLRGSSLVSRRRDD